MTEPLAALSQAELKALASALRAGRLGLPLAQLALAPYLGRAAGVTAPSLARLTTEGLSAEHLAFFLDLLAAERDRSFSVDDVVELVSTGPEVPGYPTRDTRIVVRELFQEADLSVLVAGYAVYQGRDVFQSLAVRMSVMPGLSVRMFLDVQRPHGDTSKSSEILRRFAQRFREKEWPGERLPEVYFDPRSLNTEGSTRTSLHAKCVVIDMRTAFISSANFTEAAQVRNIEVGALIRSTQFARQLANHFNALAEHGVLERVPGF